MTHDAHSVAVEAENVTVIRGQTVILDGLSCRIPRGSCSAILGRNGCGKTSFTRALTGHMFMTRGQIHVLGETVGQTDMRALRRRIAVVNPTADSGSAHISGAVVDADLTAHQAVLTGFFHTVGLYDRPTAEQCDRAEHLLRDVGLAHRLHLRFSLLSTGEQRRCLVARALATVPELLILDEPTAGLDVAGREHVLATVDAILRSPAAPTVLLITHHVEELPPQTSQVMLMRDGKFIRTGSPRDVITPESLSETFGCKVYVRRAGGRYWLEVLPEAWLELLPRS